MKNNNKNYKKKNYSKKGGYKNEKAEKINAEDREFTETSRSNEHGHTGHNDPKWYAVNEQILKDAASLSFYQPAGTESPSYVARSTSSIYPNYSLPGLMTINFDMIPGLSITGASAINIAARNLYSQVRHKNSGAANYDAPDLMLYLLAMDSILALYSTYVRIYGLMNLYSQGNRFYPRILVESQLVDWEDLQEHLADFRYFINVMALKINTLAIPSNFTVFQRHAWMCSTVFADSEDIKAQLYMYKLNGHWVYDELSGAGQLKYIEWNADETNAHYPYTTALKFDDLRVKLESAVNTLLESQDIAIMAGDLLKAFGPESMVRVNQISADYIVTPEANNLGALEQIHNSQASGRLSINLDDGTLVGEPVITQDMNGSIKCNPTLYMKRIARERTTDKDHFYLSMRSGTTPGDVMVATRMHSAINGYGVDNAVDPTGAVYTTTLDSAGTEICTDYSIWARDLETGKSVRLGIYTNWGDSREMIFPDHNGYKGYPATYFFPVFDWHPGYTEIREINGELYSSPTMLDFNNYAVFSKSDLRKLHDCAVINEFSVPVLGL